jgi:hypothetical protein
MQQQALGDIMRQLPSLLSKAGVVALALSFVVPADAQTAKRSKLDDCRAAAQRIEDDPTSFKCDWKAVIRMAPGSALIGRYDGRLAGTDSMLTILDGSAAPALVGIATIARKSGNNCSIKATGQRAANDALVVVAQDERNCSISIVSSGPNQVRVTSTKACRTLCGLDAGFDGTYQLRE